MVGELDALLALQEAQTAPGWTPRFAVGADVLARWDEDLLYYPARVLSVVSEGVYLVVFVEYGNEQETAEDHLRLSVTALFDDRIKDNADAAAAEAKRQEEARAAIRRREQVPRAYWRGSFVSHFRVQAFQSGLKASEKNRRDAQGQDKDRRKSVDSMSAAFQDLLQVSFSRRVSGGRRSPTYGSRVPLPLRLEHCRLRSASDSS